MLHCLLKVTAACALFWVWTLVVFNRWSGVSMVTQEHYLFYCLLVAIALTVDAVRSHQTKVDFLNIDFIRNCTISFRQTLTVLLIWLLFLVGAKDMVISRKFLFTFIPPLFLLCLYANATFPRLLARFVFSGEHIQNTIVMGGFGGATGIRRWLERKHSYGVRLVGIVTDEAVAELPSDLPFLGPTACLEQSIRATKATQVVAVGRPASTEAMNQLVDLCLRLGVRLLVAEDFEESLGRKATLVEEDGLHILGFHRDPLECPFNRVTKRSLDLAIAIPATLFILPVVSLVVWVLQQIQSPGPLFFRQMRTGMFDRDFRIYKFRTMRVDNPDEALQARVNDDRVFSAGRWMRRFSIDEIPQFLNVLRGEMSIVGPRPHMRIHDEQFKQAANAYLLRCFIKPGMTGLAQVRDQRGETRTDKDVIDRVRSDLDYLENWSFLLDGLIILKTIWKVIFPGRNAF